MNLTTLYFYFHQDYMSNYIEEGDIWGDIPSGWWMSNASCFYCLAALVHRGNPDILRNAGQSADEIGK